MLSRRADLERQEPEGLANGRADQTTLVGRIDPDEPKYLQALRSESRLRRMALSTERAYVKWV